MSTNKKVLSIVIAILLSVSFVSIAVFIYNFKAFSIKITKERAISIAQNVRDGLTAHMVNGTMDNRALFLDNIAKNQNIENFHLLRTSSVSKQYGDGLYGETRASNIEKDVVKTAKIHTKLIETVDKVVLKIAIPYIASSSSEPNCMQCHNTKEGEVLGAISMDIEVSSTRLEGLLIASKILLIVLIILFISIWVATYYIKPYVKLFDDLENGISQAYKGDFSYKVDTTLTNEAGIVAKRLNELSEIYKFKKTIELDENKEVIYNRIVHILQSKFQINQFILFEVDVKNKERVVVFDSVDLQNVKLDENVNVCRAYRTSSHVYSSDFDDICLNCKQKSSQYICLNYIIDEDYSLILHIQSSSIDEINRIKEYIPVISNYFEMSKPVIESKILMSILKETTLRDPMTTLYNRRFLNELLDSNVATRVKENCNHAILMIDIDFFKKVNDTYGHDVGDTVIKKLALIMKESVRNSDMPVRYGGEEFLILLTNTNREKTFEISEHIRKEFENVTFSGNSEMFSKTLSIGISHYPNDADSLWKTIKYADEALYVAKNTGRNQTIEFEKKMHTDGEDY
ncbi:MAG: GGDEF domain-containing protein [Campylobacterota bacterium]|nr:GGDEF domain-containing protein [Campylobacterota bacterium]